MCLRFILSSGLLIGVFWGCHHNPDGTSLFNANNKRKKVQVLYSNGKVCIEGYYSSGLREGLWTFRDPEGRITRQGKYNKGKPVSVWIEFDHLNKLRMAGKYQTHAIYNESSDKIFSGKTIMVVDTNDSVIIPDFGDGTEWIDSGEPDIETYEDEVREGVWKVANLNDSLIYKLRYSNGTIIDTIW
jgi:antitoxin component YwqK of YwqJK toxin-antitoxin module